MLKLIKILIKRRRKVMSKITKKLFEDFKETKKSVKSAKFSHQKNVDKIKEIIKPLVDEKYLKNNCHHYISSIEFCYDEDITLDPKLPIEYEWRKISEREYLKIYNENKNKDPRFNNSVFGTTKIKEEYIYEPEYKELYYKQTRKRVKYLKVYVEESWGYGGHDNVSFDFLLTDIMDEQYLRKEKLEKLEKL